jgi:hypothetical protein
LLNIKKTHGSGQAGLSQIGTMVSNLRGLGDVGILEVKPDC